MKIPAALKLCLIAMVAANCFMAFCISLGRPAWSHGFAVGIWLIASLGATILLLLADGPAHLKTFMAWWRSL